METPLNHCHQMQAISSENGFATFNHVLKTIVLQGHLEVDNEAAENNLITRIYKQLDMQEASKFVIRLDEMNIPTTKLLFHLFKAAKSYTSGRIRVCWVCDHEDQLMIETGLDLGEMFGVEVTILPV